MPHKRPRRPGRLPRLTGGYLVLLATTLAAAGCFTSPEACLDCRAEGVDAGVDRQQPVDRRGAGGARGTGGLGGGGISGAGGIVGVGGALGAGGTTGAGGAVGAGGSIGAGGRTATGGATGAGGATGMGGATGAGGSAAGGAGGAIDVDLVAWYELDETNGNTALDSSGHGRTATLRTLGGGSASFSTTHKVGTGALNLASNNPTNGGFATISASLQSMGATTAVTIACWVNVRTARIWQRAFDFGSSSTISYMFLTTNEGMTASNAPRFAITTAGNQAEQVIDMTTPAALSVGVWHHLAVVLGAGATYTGTLYVDKVAVGSNPAMTLRPSDLGNTTNNWLGRSQFTTADALFDGLIDDVRIYRRALTAAEIAALP